MENQKLFEEFPYKRPDLDQLKEEFRDLTQTLRNAEAFLEVQAAIEEASRLQNDVGTMSSLASIRNSMDTRDPYYEAEKDYFDEILPILQEYTTEYYRALAESPFSAEIEQAYGKHILDLARQEVKKFIPAMIEDLQEDNRLSSQYQKLLASCQMEFMGEVRNLYGITKFLEDPDRSVRKAAFQAWASFFAENEETLDALFDDLVRVRTSMAKKMGFSSYVNSSFVDLGYLMMDRLDYGQEQVAAFRKQVREVIVPLCTQLYERQAKRIGVDHLKYCDEAFSFPTGNAAPKGDAWAMLDAAGSMYRDMSPETGAFFAMMRERRLMDLLSRPGKAVGGYCDYLPDFGAPFIFSNFNGTSADIDVLTHEAGHAFMADCSAKHNRLPEYLFGSSESCEIHSMSMEFFAYPYMELFLGDQADKYRFAHMSDALTFIPYGVAVDEFQHLVYANPSMTPGERKAAWRQLEKTYLPHRDYDGEDLMERGGYWFRQLHIFMYPFYYIDYTLAAMSAFEFYGKMQKNRSAAWDDYYRLCCAGGSESYLDLLKIGNLMSPFEPGTVEAVIAPIAQTLREIDDTKL